MADPEWSDFKIILALARGGSVAGAARVMAVDHSTVSRRLAALEDSMGARLIVRGGREFAWTAEGRTLLVAAEAMESAIASAILTVRAAKLEIEGAVRVSCAPGFVPILMQMMLPKVRAKHPLLTIEFSGEHRAVELAKGEADIAVRMSRPAELDLVARQAFECGWCVYASKAYVAARGLPSSVDALPSHSLVLYVEAMHSVAPLRWMEAHRGPPTQIARVDNLETASQLMASGGGIGVLPCFVGEPMGELVRVFPVPIGFTTGWIVYHEAMRSSVRVRATVDALVEFFQKEGKFFSGRVGAAVGTTGMGC
jgi:DNA-binding transcriptional LysR family regulator